jgi:hypothetical protein
MECRENGGTKRSGKCDHGKQKGCCVICDDRFNCVHGKRKYDCVRCVHPSKLCVPHGNIKTSCRLCKKTATSLATPLAVLNSDDVEQSKSDVSAVSFVVKCLDFDSEITEGLSNSDEYMANVTGIQDETDASDLSFLSIDTRVNLTKFLLDVTGKQYYTDSTDFSFLY